MNVVDENPAITDGERLPVYENLTVIRYRTLKKNPGLGWWSAVVLLEDHARREICYYRWRRRGDQWKRDKKLSFRSARDWHLLQEAMQSFVGELA